MFPATHDVHFCQAPVQQPTIPMPESEFLLMPNFNENDNLQLKDSRVKQGLVVWNIPLLTPKYSM